MKFKFWRVWKARYEYYKTIDRWYSFNLRYNLEDVIDLTEEVSKLNVYNRSLRSEYEDRVGKLLKQLSDSRSTHEAEIIRLKDIIQAKQIQLDKLLKND